MDRWTIYCHVHTESGRRYVGLTKFTMMHRWNQHCAQAKRSKGRSYFANSIRKYGKSAFTHEVLETCETLGAGNAAEERWIEKLGTKDPEKGFNLMRGGEHVPHPFRNPWDRPEYRARMAELSRERSERAKASRPSKKDVKVRGDAEKARASAAGKARWSDPPYRERMLSSFRSDEARLRVSRVVTGRVLSPEVKQAISQRLSGTSKPPEVREKIAASLRGRTLGEETRRKICEARAGQSVSPEARRKIAAANTGKRHSEESKRKMSASQKARHA